LADVRDVDFSGAHLGGVRLADANLLRAGFKGALLDAFWSNTICPDGTNSDLDDGDAKSCANNLIP
ncbi:MAG: pentapeptide repeat-containing protein, partial [Anaerolineaceae bacterium]